jgi:hypothetical protein
MKERKSDRTTRRSGQEPAEFGVDRDLALVQGAVAALQVGPQGGREGVPERESFRGLLLQLAQTLPRGANLLGGPPLLVNSPLVA